MRAKILDLKLFGDGEGTDLRWWIVARMEAQCLKT